MDHSKEAQKLDDADFLEKAIRHPEILTPKGALRLFDCVRNLQAQLTQEIEARKEAGYELALLKDHVGSDKWLPEEMFKLQEAVDKAEVKRDEIVAKLEAALAVVECAESLTCPEGSLDAAGVNPGPEKDQLENALRYFNLLRKGWDKK